MYRTVAPDPPLLRPQTEDDHQTKENHKISHKTDIVDQTVEIFSIETTIHDQIQEIDVIQMINLETLCIIEKENIPTIRIEIIQMIEIINIKIKDHAIILTTDQTIKDQNRMTINVATQT